MYRLFGVVCCVLLLASGCKNDGLVSLQGQVTVDGQPAYEGICLQFQPIAGGSPSYAETDAEGKYEAQFTFKTAGIQPGEHRVSLMPGGGGGSGEQIPDDIVDGKPVGGSRGKRNGGRPKLPDKYYGEITTITVENSSNNIDIALSTTDVEEESPNSENAQPANAEESGAAE